MADDKLEVRLVKARVEYRYQFVLRLSGSEATVTMPETHDTREAALTWYETNRPELYVVLNQQELDHPEGGGKPGLYRVATNIQILEDLGSVE